jgi:hypothetical protein
LTGVAVEARALRVMAGTAAEAAARRRRNAPAYHHFTAIYPTSLGPTPVAS